MNTDDMALRFALADGVMSVPGPYTGFDDPRLQMSKALMLGPLMSRLPPCGPDHAMLVHGFGPSAEKMVNEAKIMSEHLDGATKARLCTATERAIDSGLPLHFGHQNLHIAWRTANEKAHKRARTKNNDVRIREIEAELLTAGKAKAQELFAEKARLRAENNSRY